MEEFSRRSNWKLAEQLLKPRMYQRYTCNRVYCEDKWLGWDSEKKGDHMGGYLRWSVSRLNSRLDVLVLGSCVGVARLCGCLEKCFLSKKGRESQTPSMTGVRAPPGRVKRGLPWWLLPHHTLHASEYQPQPYSNHTVPYHSSALALGWPGPGWMRDLGTETAWVPRA